MDGVFAPRRKPRPYPDARFQFGDVALDDGLVCGIVQGIGQSLGANEFRLDALILRIMPRLCWGSHDAIMRWRGIGSAFHK